jgi:hypothetical protein
VVTLGLKSKTKYENTVPDSLDKSGRRRRNLLLSKRWHLLPAFWSKEPGSVFLVWFRKGSWFQNRFPWCRWFSRNRF